MAEPTQPTAPKPPDVAVEDDSDPDFDDLDGKQHALGRAVKLITMLTLID
jgi:hypothetical protein